MGIFHYLLGLSPLAIFVPRTGIRFPIAATHKILFFASLGSKPANVEQLEQRLWQQLFSFCLGESTVLEIHQRCRKLINRSKIHHWLRTLPNERQVTDIAEGINLSTLQIAPAPVNRSTPLFIPDDDEDIAMNDHAACDDLQESQVQEEEPEIARPHGQEDFEMDQDEHGQEEPEMERPQAQDPEMDRVGPQTRKRRLVLPPSPVSSRVKRHKKRVHKIHSVTRSPSPAPEIEAVYDAMVEIVQPEHFVSGHPCFRLSLPTYDLGQDSPANLADQASCVRLEIYTGEPQSRPRFHLYRYPMGEAVCDFGFLSFLD